MHQPAAVAVVLFILWHAECVLLKDQMHLNNTKANTVFEGEALVVPVQLCPHKLTYSLNFYTFSKDQGRQTSDELKAQYLFSQRTWQGMQFENLITLNYKYHNLTLAF